MGCYYRSTNLPGGASGKESACQGRKCNRFWFNSGSRRSPGGGNGTPHWYSRLGNPMDRRVWPSIVHGDLKESDMTEHLSTQHITEILKFGCLTNDGNLFLTVVEAGSPRLRCSMVEFWWSPSCRLFNDIAHHILTRQRAEGESKLICDLQELWSHSPPWCHLILVTSLRSSLLIPSHEGRDRLSAYELGRGEQAFSSHHKIVSTKYSTVMNEVKNLYS